MGKASRGLGGPNNEYEYEQPASGFDDFGTKKPAKNSSALA
jgi:hypothetical protein